MRHTHLIAHNGRVCVQNPDTIFVLAAVKHTEGALHDGNVQKVQRRDAQATVAVQCALEGIAAPAGQQCVAPTPMPQATQAHAMSTHTA